MHIFFGFSSWILKGFSQEAFNLQKSAAPKETSKIVEFGLKLDRIQNSANSTRSLAFMNILTLRPQVPWTKLWKSSKQPTFITKWRRTQPLQSYVRLLLITCSGIAHEWSHQSLCCCFSACLELKTKLCYISWHLEFWLRESEPKRVNFQDS